MLKILIAEDDPYARILLRGVLEGIQGTSVVAEAETGRQLVELVNMLKPDVIFVDVEMPEMNGIDAVTEIINLNPNIFIVFATAYMDYALEAFRVYAFDYLLKPFDSDRIIKTIKRIQDFIAESNQSKLSEGSHIPGKESGKLLVQSIDKWNIVNVKDIILVTRSGRKTLIYTIQGMVTTYEPLTQIEEKLKREKFFRCHKGYIINVEMILEILPSGKKTYLVRMANTKELALMTREKLTKFKEKYCIR